MSILKKIKKYILPNKKKQRGSILKDNPLDTNLQTQIDLVMQQINQGSFEMAKDLITKNILTTLIDQIINKIEEKGFNAKFLVTGESTENTSFRTLATHLNLLNTGNDFINQSFHPYYSKEFLIDEGDKIKLIDFGDQSTYDNKLSQLSELQTKKLKEELLEELNRLKELCNKTAEMLLKDGDQSEISISTSSQLTFTGYANFYQPSTSSKIGPQNLTNLQTHTCNKS